MAEGGHGQNVGKQVVQPWFKAREQNWTFAQNLHRIKGEVKHEALYLGGMMVVSGSFLPERDRRVLASRQAWCSLGGFWFSGPSPCTVLRS